MSIIFLIGDDHESKKGRELALDLMRSCYENHMQVNFMIEGLLGGEFEKINTAISENKRPENEIAALLYDIFLLAKDEGFNILHMEMPLELFLTKLEKEPLKPNQLHDVALVNDPHLTFIQKDDYDNANKLVDELKKMDKNNSEYPEKIGSLYKTKCVQALRNTYFSKFIEDNKDKAAVTIIFVGSNHFSSLKNVLTSQNNGIRLPTTDDRTKEFLGNAKAQLKPQQSTTAPIVSNDDETNPNEERSFSMN